MTGSDLLKQLQKLTPKQLKEEVRLVNNENDEENIWLTDIEVSEKGESGYESGGEIRLIGSE